MSVYEREPQVLKLRQLNEQSFDIIRIQLMSDNEVIKVLISPADHNNKIIGSSQDFVSSEKYSRAINNLDDPIRAILLRRVRQSTNQVVIEAIITDGHHRLAINILENRDTIAIIHDTWDLARGESKPNYLELIKGFNCIIQQIRRFRPNI